MFFTIPHLGFMVAKAKQYISVRCNRFHESIVESPFEYWLVHKNGQWLTFCATLIVVSVTWMLILHLRGKHIEDEDFDPLAEDFSDYEGQSRYEDDGGPRTPRSQIIPERPRSVGSAGTDLPNRLYLPDSPSTVPQSPLADAITKNNLSVLEREAPVAYASLQRHGYINKDGTPTKKALADKRIPWGKTTEAVKEVALKIATSGKVDELATDAVKRGQMRRMALERMKAEVDDGEIKYVRSA